MPQAPRSWLPQEPRVLGGRSLSELLDDPVEVPQGRRSPPPLLAPNGRVQHYGEDSSDTSSDTRRQVQEALLRLQPHDAPNADDSITVEKREKAKQKQKQKRKRNLKQNQETPLTAAEVIMNSSTDTQPVRSDVPLAAQLDALGHDAPVHRECGGSGAVGDAVSLAAELLPVTYERQRQVFSPPPPPVGAAGAPHRRTEVTPKVGCTSWDTRRPSVALPPPEQGGQQPQPQRVPLSAPEWRERGPVCEVEEGRREWKEEGGEGLVLHPAVHAHRRRRENERVADVRRPAARDVLRSSAALAALAGRDLNPPPSSVHPPPSSSLNRQSPARTPATLPFQGEIRDTFACSYSPALHDTADDVWGAREPSGLEPHLPLRLTTAPHHSHPRNVPYPEPESSDDDITVMILPPATHLVDSPPSRPFSGLLGRISPPPALRCKTPVGAVSHVKGPPSRFPNSRPVSPVLAFTPRQEIHTEWNRPPLMTPADTEAGRVRFDEGEEGFMEAASGSPSLAPAETITPPVPVSPPNITLPDPTSGKSVTFSLDDSGVRLVEPADGAGRVSPQQPSRSAGNVVSEPVEEAIWDPGSGTLVVSPHRKSIPVRNSSVLQKLRPMFDSGNVQHNLPKSTVPRPSSRSSPVLSSLRRPDTHPAKRAPDSLPPTPLGSSRVSTATLSPRKQPPSPLHKKHPSRPVSTDPLAKKPLRKGAAKEPDKVNAKPEAADAKNADKKPASTKASCGCLVM